MAKDDVIYQEVWPLGHISHLKLTSQAFMASIYKLFIPLATIPVTAIRHVEISRLELNKVMAISYYKTPNTFTTATFSIDDMEAWYHAFISVGITVD